jgi:hypothetical protein
MLISRRFVSLAIATAVALSGCIVATLFYGAELWPAFLRAANQASGFLAAGYYPQFRMVTVFATLNSLGAGPWLSFLAQGVVAIFAIGAIVWGIARELPFRLQAAIVCASTLSISPYCYDYDLTILGVGLAFVLPDLIARISRREGLALWLLLWLGCGQGFALNTVFAHVASSSWLGAASDCPSLSAPVLLALYAMCIHVLRRPASEPESYLLAKAQRST